jgi:U3 small nucleolar RNA-associated protein 25
MKRKANDLEETSVVKRKHDALHFSAGPDPFSMFFAVDQALTARQVCSLDPIPELVLLNCPAQYLASPHRRLSGFSPTPLFNLLSNYPDCLLIDSDASLPTSSIIFSHLLNHIYKTKSLIENNSLSASPVKDQGFTSAIVLILVPTQLSAKVFIDFLVASHCKGNWKKVSKFSRKKYDEIFNDESRNDSDAVKLGISLGEKEVSLFSAFRRSDIVLATPLSLKQCLERSDGTTDNGILSSIQICAVMETQLLLMQNWDHVEFIFSAMNKIPERDAVTVDLCRIRDEYLDGSSSSFRQLLLQTAFITPVLMSLFSRNTTQRGKAKSVEHYPSPPLSTTQQFRKFAVDSIPDIPEKRFAYFTAYWSRVKEELLPKALLLVPSYFEFVRVKAYLEEHDPGVSCVCEYTAKADRQRALAMWNAGTAKAICVTERLMHFRPMKLKEIRQIVVYSLPDFKEVYVELAEQGMETVVIFCKFDGFALQRVVGDARAEKLIMSNSEIFSLS